MAIARREPRWLNRLILDAIHVDQLREHGGLGGIRDENALESALARPPHLWLYGKRPDMPSLGAAYGFGLVRSHPYADGNKRVGFLAMVTFLGLNGHEFVATDAEIVTKMFALADGSVPEEALAGWLRERSRRRR